MSCEHQHRATVYDPAMQNNIGQFISKRANLNPTTEAVVGHHERHPDDIPGASTLV